MRARYSAYVRQDSDFLMASWHPDTRPEAIAPDPGTEWLGLTIVATDRGSGLDANGEVEFRARFERGGSRLELHEFSTFERVDGHWMYRDGLDPDTLP